MNRSELDGLDWGKGGGLIPAIVQHTDTRAVLMLGYMNREALERTLAERRVTFFSRSRAALWTKGETSGNAIAVDSVSADCDRDTLLVIGRPAGPVCHTGAADCFGGDAQDHRGGIDFLTTLESIIEERIAVPDATGYTARLYSQGPLRIAQKVGEEGLEVALAAAAQGDAELLAEAADLLYHLLVLLRSRGQSLGAVVAELRRRHEATVRG